MLMTVKEGRVMDGVATYNLDIPVFVEHEVLGLEISVHNLVLLQVLERMHDLRRVTPHQLHIQLF